MSQTAFSSSLRPRPALKLLGALLVAGTLSGCTGTEETAPALRLALLLAGGTQLATVDTAPADGSAATTYTPTLSTPLDVAQGRELYTVSGRTLLLVRQDAAESRDVTLKPVNVFAAPPFTPCWQQSAFNPARTRLAVLSQCPNDAVQRLALYDTAGTVIWTASLGTAPVTTNTVDAPPVRVAVVGDVAVVSRPALGGGSEVIRAAPNQSTDPAFAKVAVTSAPERTVAIRDLALLGTVIHAATDSGVYPLLDTGLPDLTKRVVALGERRYDRLWGANLGTRNLLLAWRDNAIAGGGDQYLRVWDGTSATAQNVTYVNDLRDLTLAPDGNLYLLSRTALTRYDAVLGLQNGNWQPRSLLNNLGDARALTWLIP
ncbi:MAG: hypothetical protein Q4C89_10440 [Deinococcus sp.]|uniref:hypothetical protein n=1 Tax=Deinococcus sp. TaxID=47478 RepID=UPI0026DC1AA4|nr:hypothetical protein [Deinococcus sp.]MDO4246431.1 hypothetical protein [Deinococcus sp.]